MIERIKQIIAYYGLSASNFADTINVPRSSISHLLSGRNKPSLDFVIKVVDNFDDVELKWLVYGNGEFPKSNVQTTNTINTSTPKEQAPLLFPESEPTEKKTSVVKSMQKQTSISNKKLLKIVLLYSDGSFEEYK